MIAVQFGVVVRRALLQVLKAGSKITHRKIGNTERVMRLHEKHRVLLVLGKAQQLLADGDRPGQVAPHDIIDSQAE